MKKSLSFFAFFLWISIVSAQTRGETRMQIGGDYGFRTNLLGLSIGAEYFFAQRISIAPNYTQFFPESGKRSTLNMDARLFLTEGRLQWYGMSGLTNNWNDVDGRNYSSTGLNLGFGGDYKFADRLALNPEFKIQLVDERQFLFRLAIIYILN